MAISKLKPLQELLSGVGKTVSNAGNNFWGNAGVQNNVRRLDSVLGANATLPKVSLSKYTPQFQSQNNPNVPTWANNTRNAFANVANLPINLVSGIAEGVINAPGRAFETGARSTNLFNDVINNKQPLTGTKLVNTVAPFATAAIDIYGLGMGKQIAKEGFKQAVKKGFLKTVGEGSLKGMAYGGGRNFFNAASDSNVVKENSLQSTIQPTLEGAGGGLILGGALSGLGVGMGIIKQLTTRTPAIEAQLIKLSKSWKVGETPIKPGGMPKKVWAFQQRFNTRYKRNPYLPVHLEDIQTAIEIESKNIPVGISVKPLTEAEHLANQAKPSLPEVGGVGVSALNKEVLPKISPQVPETPVVSGVTPPSIPPTNEIPLNPIIPLGAKERGFITTVKESKNTPQEPKATLNSYYNPTTNSQESANAANTLGVLGWDKAKSQIQTGVWSGDNAALSELMAQKSFAEGKWNEGNEIIKTASVKATQAGQGDQALAMWSKSTPEGMVKYAQSEIQKATNDMPLLNRILGKKSEWVAEDSKAITGMMRNVNSLPEGQEKTKAMQQVFEYISKKLPWGVSDVIDEFRYNNMLSNPLTHLRNGISNLQQAFLVRPATLVAQGKPIEAVKYELGTLSGISDGISAFKNSFKSGTRFAKIDMSEMGSQLNKPKRLGAYNLPSNAMEGMDKFFTSIIKAGEQARGATEAEASKMADYSLFRGDLNPVAQGRILNSIDNVTKAVYQLRKVGLGWFIPFIRTSMDVAKQWIEYSPVGLTDIGLSKATGVSGYNGREQLGKAMLGSIATLIGAEVAMQGRTTWEVPADPIQKKLFYDSGRKPYSVKIGDYWVPMQIFGVFALALALPAAVKYFNDNSRTATTDDQVTKLTKELLSPLGFWSQQTFVSGLGSFVNLVQGNTDFSMTRNLTQIIGQLNPMGGFQRYVSTIIDPIFRKPDINSFSQQLSSGIPFLTKNLSAYTDIQGNPSSRNISNYIAPYAMGQANPQFEQMYQQRTDKLQSNATENQIKKQIEQNQGRSQIKDNKIFYWDPESANTKSIDLGSVSSLPSSTNYEKAVKKDAAYKLVDNILTSTLKPEEKQQALQVLGISTEDASYYNIAKQSTDLKNVYVTDEISRIMAGTSDRGQMLNYLASQRKEVNGSMVLADAVVTQLYNDQLISKDEETQLKNLKIINGTPKIKVSGRGKKATLFKLSNIKTIQAKKIKLGGDLTKYKLSNLKSKTQSAKIQGVRIEQYK